MVAVRVLGLVWDWELIANLFQKTSFVVPMLLAFLLATRVCFTGVSHLTVTSCVQVTEALWVIIVIGCGTHPAGMGSAVR